MPGRLLTIQRQARELGRLRTGLFDTSGPKGRPVRSDTWIVSSHAEHYIQAAAEFWGGEVEKWQPQGGGAAQWRVVTEEAALDAILPPGDPLSQSLEQWNKGGAARRCDGLTEHLSDSPCICRAKFGDAFHEQPVGTVCAATTRLNVFLPEMPDVGVWRMETKSHYAAMEIAGAVDLIKSAVGPEAVIPIRLRIEQRQRKAEGKTKRFPVVVVELRGITTGQVLAGSVMGGALPAPKPREAIEAPAVRALEAAPAVPVTTDRDSVEASLRAIQASGTIADLRQVWPEAKAAGLEELALKIADEFKQNTAPPAVVESAPSDDVDALWAEIMRTVPADWSTSKVEEQFTASTGVPVETANASDMQAYLVSLRGAK
jgi:hypothetical protein